ncbi:xanthine dehydrogenase family protein molybdopterin-binding subunit, partial [Streptomyces sp. A7024]
LAVAEAVGLLPTAVTVHVGRAGGGFGRRIYPDAEVEAARASKALGRPVRLLWTRNDDMRHSRCRPASHHRVRVALAAGGAVLAWQHQMVQTAFPPISELEKAVPVVGWEAFFALQSLLPYDWALPVQLLTPVDVPVPGGAWRSVFSGQLTVANELVLDEVAHAAGRDRLAFRRTHAKGERAKSVLDKVAEAAGWGRALPSGQAQGVALHEEYGSTVAHVAEVDVGGGAPRVTRITVAADVGLPVNPRGVEAQLQGAAMDAVGITLTAGLHVSDGAVVEGSYADYHWPRMRDAPARVDVHLLRSDHRIGGVGELGFPSAAAAIACAVARATGTTPRSFPIAF